VVRLSLLAYTDRADVPLNRAFVEVALDPKDQLLKRDPILPIRDTLWDLATCRVTWEDAVVSAMAGPIAQRLYQRNPMLFWGQWRIENGPDVETPLIFSYWLADVPRLQSLVGDDNEFLTKLRDGRTPGGPVDVCLRVLFARAQSLVTENWGAVEAIAAAALQDPNGTLSDEQINEICCRSLPKALVDQAMEARSRVVEVDAIASAAAEADKSTEGAIPATQALDGDFTPHPDPRRSCPNR